MEIYFIRLGEHRIARVFLYVSGRGVVERWIVPEERAEESVLVRWREEHRRRLGFEPSW